MTASSGPLPSQGGTRAGSSNHSTHEAAAGDEEHAIRHANNHLAVPATSSSPNSPDQDDAELRARRKTLLAQGADFFRRAIGDAANGSTAVQKAPQEVHLETLVTAYAESDVSKSIRHEIDGIKATNNIESADQTRDVAEESNMLRGRRRASWLTQFRILSGRAFKNLYRNPLLLTAHYAAAISIARELIVRRQSRTLIRAL